MSSQLKRKGNFFILILIFIVSGLMSSSWAGDVTADSSSTRVGPNLFVDEVTFSPQNPQPGEDVTISITVRNGGDDSPYVGYTNLYVNPDDVPPTRDTEPTRDSGIYTTLPAGEAYPIGSFTDDFFLEDGKFPVYVWVDYRDDVDESHEEDNLSEAYCIVVGTGEGVDRCPPSESGFADIYETNDQCADAVLIEPDGTIRNHDLTPNVEGENDADWFKFEATSGMTYRYEIENIGTDANVTAELWGNCRTPPFSESSAVFTYATTTSQMYYIRTDHVQNDYGNNTAWTSRLTIVEECVDHSEPNDTCHTAAPIAPGSTEQHNYCKAGDEDWTVLNVEAGVSYEITLTDDGENASSRMEVHSSCDTPFVDLSGSFTHRHTAYQDGQIFIRAKNRDETLIGDETNYTLSVTSDGACPLDDVYEPDDDSRSDATLIEVGAEHRQTHQSCPAADVDWIEFDAVAGEDYTIETLNLADEADTIITLFDPSGNQIVESDDDVDGGRASRISWEAPSSGQYTIQMRDYHEDMAGVDTQYDIQILTNDCAPDPFENLNDGDDTPLTADDLLLTDGIALREHNICPLEDKDVYRLDIDTPGSYIIETTGLGSATDVKITLLDSVGTELSYNDDGIEGGGDRIRYTFDAVGIYYVRVESFDVADFGSNITYQLRATVDDGTTPTIPQSPPDIAPPFLSSGIETDIETLILVNYAQMVEVYSSTADADAVIAMVERLALNAGVNGRVIDVSTNSVVQSEYDEWDSATVSDNVSKANDVAGAIRRVVMQELRTHNQVKYIVIVGGDEIIPFQRIKDRTRYREHEYVEDHLDTDHATGIALDQSFYLTDDCYVDRKMSSGYGRQRFCLPDLAIGRLVETADEVINFIDGYLANDTIVVDNVLVTGYDFVQDGAAQICTTWDKLFLPDAVNCSLIGDSWSLGQYSDLRINLVGSPYLVQSINGHANHGREGIPGGNGDESLGAEEIAASTANYMGGLVYTPGCHAGLNVPDDNFYSPIDLPQAYARQGINYIASTGYGWGDYLDVGLTERLMAIYTGQVTAEPTVEMGTALLDAKQLYFSQLTNESARLDKLDAKVLQQIVYYGLPMYKLQTSGVWQRRSRQNADPFPSLSFNFDPGVLTNPNQPLGGAYFVSLDLTDQAGMTETGNVSDGRYFTIDGSKVTTVNSTVQPLFYSDVGEPEADPLRGAIFIGGTYRIEQNFDPVVSSPENEYDVAESENPAPSGWDPAVPVTLRSHEQIQELLIPMGQYNAELAQQRVYSNVDVNLYYSNNSDQTPPTIAHVKGVYNLETGDVTFSVNATDLYGVDDVIVAYTEGTGVWESEYLTLNDGKWVNIVDGSPNMQFFIQAVDEHGNVAYDTNKNHYYTPMIIQEPSFVTVTPTPSPTPMPTSTPVPTPAVPLQVGLSQSTTNTHHPIILFLPILISLVVFTNLFRRVQKRP